MSIRRILPTTLLTAGLLLSGCDSLLGSDAIEGTSRIEADHRAPDAGADRIEDHYIVVLSPQPAAAGSRARLALEALTDELGARSDARLGSVYQHALTGFAVEMPAARVAALRNDPRVLFVEQDARVYPSRSHTFQENATWGLDRIDQRALPLDQQYSFFATGAGVRAYIVDTGIRMTHDEFGGRASLGKDFFGGLEVEGEDCYGHGTHVAGTVGGTTYGVAKAVELVSVRIFGCSGGTTFEMLISAVDWLTANAVKPAVVNLSLSGPSHAAADMAVRNSIESGLTYAIAAGNGNHAACLSSPARVAEGLTVGATTQTDERAAFSNFGECVDIFAPGVAITSALHGSDSETAVMSGTSMAAPHVAGVAALFLENAPGASPAAVFEAIAENATMNVVSNSLSTNDHLLYSLFEQEEVEPEPGDFLLTTDGFKVRGRHTIDLTWQGSTADHVDVYRNGALIAAAVSDVGSYRDATDVTGNHATYTHRVCEAASQTCSNLASTAFGDGGDDGGGSNAPPTASFTYEIDGLSVSFTDTSTDSDGAVLGWSWTFGDGGTSAAQNPVHAYDSAGSFTVTLTVEDDEGATDAASQVLSVGQEPPPPGAIVLEAEGYVRGAWQYVELDWTGASSGSVEVYRDGQLIATVSNESSYRDRPARSGTSASYVHWVCEAGSDLCSNQTTTPF